MNKLRFNRSLCYGAIVASLLVSGCTLGPDFKAPGHSELLTYMGTKAPLEQQQVSAAERGWKEIYQDLHLQNLIEKALKNNLDLRIAQSKKAITIELYVTSKTFCKCFHDTFIGIVDLNNVSMIIWFGIYTRANREGDAYTKRREFHWFMPQTQLLQFLE